MEFISLGEKVEGGVDEFVLNDSLINELYDKTIEGGNDSNKQGLKDRIVKITDNINELSDEIIDISLIDGGDVDVKDGSYEELAALGVIQNKIVKGVNENIEKQLSNVFDLEYGLYDTLNNYNMTAGINMEELKADMKKEIDMGNPFSFKGAISKLNQHNEAMSNI